MDIDNIVYCKKTGTPFRISRSCVLNSIKHFELESVTNKELHKKLLAETSVRESFQLDMLTSAKNPIAKFTELLKA